MIKMSYHSLLTIDDLYNINLTHNKGGRIYLPWSIVSAKRNLVNTPFGPIKFVVYYSKYDRQQQTQQTKWVPYLFHFLPTRLLKEIKSSFYWTNFTHSLSLSCVLVLFSVCLSICLSICLSWEKQFTLQNFNNQIHQRQTSPQAWESSLSVCVT